MMTCSLTDSFCQVYTSGGDPDSVAGDFGRHSLYKMLGYFSLVGLLRLHSLLGDYYQALKVMITSPCGPIEAALPAGRLLPGSQGNDNFSLVLAS